MTASADDYLVPVDASVADRMKGAVARFGEAEVVDRAIALLGGANAGDEFLLWLGGRHARGVLAGAPPLYWPELWGARALIHVWDDSAAPAIVSGLGNQAWRVREMCVKVVEAHGVRAHDQLLALLSDEVPRVRAASARALGAIGTAEDVAALEAVLSDQDIEVRRSSGAALTRLRERG